MKIPLPSSMPSARRPFRRLPSAPLRLRHPPVQRTGDQVAHDRHLLPAPSPESAPYVEVGTEVNPETVVCIIEAMKVMNEIKAEAKGVITQVLVENAKPVEFGQPLFKIRPSLNWPYHAWSWLNSRSSASTLQRWL